MKNSKNIIVWLEDRDDTVREQFKYCESLGYEIQHVKMPHTLLSRVKEFHDQIKLIIIDVLLYGVNDLSTVGIDGCDTELGLSAGWVILDKILRPSPDDPIPEHILQIDTSIPVLVTSTPSVSNEHKQLISNILKRDPNAGRIEYIEKGALDDDDGDWSKNFEILVNEILSQDSI